MKRFFVFPFLTVALLVLTAGCVHPQPAPSPGYNTQWTWPAPTTQSGNNWPGCSSSAACSYIVSTTTIASGGTCPAPTGTNYTPQQTTSTALTTNSWTQTNTTGETVCAVVSTVQSGLTSAASPQSAAVTSPALPLAPTAPSGSSQVAMDVKPALPTGPPPASPELVMMAIPGRPFGKVVPR